MTVMKIRGGDLDLVEYHFTSFLPGEIINPLPTEKKITLTPKSGKVTAEAPARIHLTVLDMNRFSPRRPGGGGVGFAIQLYSKVEVSCTENDIEIDYTRPGILTHLAFVMKKITGYKGGFRIKAYEHEHTHVGLGSTSTVMTASALAMNHILGEPLSNSEVRNLIGYNYVEETEEGKVIFGFETGVGPAVCSLGGMAVMGDELTLIFQHPFAFGKNVFIVIPPIVISSSGEHEFDLLMNRARSLDYRDRELKAYMMMMDLIPALEKGDLKKIGEVIWETEFRGSKRAEIEHHGFGIYQYMAKMRDSGLEFVGMSSVGPSIAIVTERTEEEVGKIIEKIGLSITIATKVDNTGIIIKSG